MKNLNQEDELSKEIEGFFLDLASTRPHLAHLADLSVKVHDWGDVERLLLEQPTCCSAGSRVRVPEAWSRSKTLQT